MERIKAAPDMTGRELTKGDIVTTRTSENKSRVCDLANDGGTTFVCLRPIHQPYAPGEWHAADRVLWNSRGRRR